MRTKGRSLCGVFVGFFLFLLGLGLCGQDGASPWVWGPVLGAIGEDYVAISWNTTPALPADLHYARREGYESTGAWEETLSFEPHAGVAEIRLGNLKPGTAYSYQLVLYDGDAAYPSPVGAFTTSSQGIPRFSFLVYGDTRTFPDRHKLVADTMARNEPDAALVIHVGDLVDSPTLPEFANFFWAIGDLARSHPYLAVLGNHEKGDQSYYDFLALPPGGGVASEEWWSFDYGGVHFVGLDSVVAGNPDAVARMREEVEWLKDDLARSRAPFKVVFFHTPIYSSSWRGGVNPGLRDLLEPIFLENGVDLIFCGHMHGYEHFYLAGIHHVVTGGGGAPLQEPIKEAAEGTVFRRYEMLHYMRVTVDGDTMRVEAIPVASVYSDEVHLVPSGRPIDSFTITKAR